MATHHNLAILAGGGVSFAAALALHRASSLHCAPDRSRKISLDRAPIYDFLNRYPHRLEFPLNARKHTIADDPNRQIAAVPLSRVLPTSCFPYPANFLPHALFQPVAVQSSMPPRPRAANSQVTLFAQLPESYRPRRETLLGWIPTPRRIG